MANTILVTGASSYIGAHVLNEFLSAGYNVRGSVRSQTSAHNVLASHAKFAEQLSFVVVEDISKPGAFDEAVKGVDGVIHMQSPFWLEVEDNERDLLIPAIHGTLGLLNSISEHNPLVKRVVLTSSFAALVDMSKGLWPEHTYTEKDWNPATYEEAKAGNGAFAYCASKSLAEKAAWDFVNTEKPNFSLSVVLPPVVYGPNAHYITDLSKLNESSAMFYSLMNGSRTEVPPTGFWAIADVRDVALAHKLAYEKPQAAGQRYFITAGTYSFQMICDILREELPGLRDRVPKGDEGAPLPSLYKVDNSKSVKELGMTFRQLKEIVVDSALNYLSLKQQLGN